jgi:hypothetical protein
MAINPQKLLSPSKLSTPTGNPSVVSNTNGIFTVKKTLISIDKLLKNHLLQEKKETTKKKSNDQTKSRQEKETKLEAPKESKGIGISKLKSLMPRTGILDAAQRFVTFTFAGWVFTQFMNNLPKLTGIISKIGPVVGGIEKVIGGIFEGIVGFIDAGYKANDQIRELIKDVGGENVKKTYDDFTKNFNYITNAILTFGLSTLVQPKPTPTKSNGGIVTGYAKGGSVTRGGQVVGGAITRTFTPQQNVVKKQNLKPQQSTPGKDVGGKKQIQKLYPDPSDIFSVTDWMNATDAAGDPLTGTFKDYQSQTKKNKPNPYKALTDTSKILKKGGETGILMAAGVDLAMGQNMDNNFMNSLSADFLLKSKVNEVIQNIKKELSKKVMGGENEPTPSPDGSPGGTAGGKYGGYSPPSGLQKEIYDYLVNVKKLSDVQALGLMANINRESSFIPSQMSGDDGGSGGLFQWKIPRSNAMAKAVPDWKTNWKGQIDYALREPGEPGPQYISNRFSSSQEAADWWMEKWERPTDKIGASKIHQQYLSSVPTAPNGTAKFREGESTSSMIVKGGKIKGGAIVTQRNDPDNEQTGSDISLGNLGANIQNPFQSLKITGVGIQGGGSGKSGHGFGKYVTGETIINGKRYEILLGHLNKSLVKRGDILEYGDVIGLQGISGHATGPHVTTHVNTLNGGDPRGVLSSIENVWTSGGMIETKSMGDPTSKKQPPKQEPGQPQIRTGSKLGEELERLQQGKPPKTSSSGGGGDIIAPPNKNNFSSLSSYPSYSSEGGRTVVAVQPFIIEKPVPIPAGENKTIMFPVLVGVNNSNMASLSRG